MTYVAQEKARWVCFGLRVFSSVDETYSEEGTLRLIPREWHISGSSPAYGTVCLIKLPIYPWT